MLPMAKLKLTRTPKYKTTNQELQHAAARLLPSAFVGLEQYKPELIQAFREHVTKGVDSLLNAYAEPCQATEHIIDSLKTHMQSQPSAIAAPFIAEIDARKASNKLEPSWVLFLYLRYAAASSNISSDEHDLFMNLVDPEMYAKILANKDYSGDYDHFGTILADDKLKLNGYYSGNLHHDFSEFTKKQLVKIGMIPTPYPIAGIGKFGIFFLLDCYLSNVFPLGLHSSTIKDGKIPVHGSRLSPFSFFAHDILHLDTDQKLDTLVTHINQATERAFTAGINAETFCKFYTPYAAKKQSLIMEALRAINYLFLRELLASANNDEFKKVMVGLFFIIHEYLQYNPEIFEENNLDRIIVRLVKNSIEKFYSFQAWESPIDPLRTSPIDGKSALSDEQIIAFAFIKLLVSDSKLQMPSNFYRTNPPKDRAEYIIENKLIQNASVTLSPSGRFIYVEFELKTGQKLKYDFTTMHHKWLNMDDSIGLLKMAGIKLVKPDLSGLTPKQSRKVAQESLKVVQAQIAKVIKHYGRRAIAFANQQQGTDKSIATNFFDAHFQCTSKINEEVYKAVRRLKPTI